MEEQKYCYVQFKFSCNLQEGEEVRVVGSIEELGKWDIKKSEKLIFSKLDIPIWKSKENIKFLKILFLNINMLYIKMVILIDGKIFQAI